MKFLSEIDINEWEIETPDGYKSINRMFKTVKYSMYEIKLDNGLGIKCADRHKLINSSGSVVFADEVSVGDVLKTKYGNSSIVSVTDLNEMDNCYDMEVDSNEHIYYTNDIVSHNTTCTVAYLLHQAITRPNITIAVLAQKESAAKEVLERIKFSFMLLPWYMKPGVMEWNKTSFTISNGDKGTKVFSSACSPDSIRGKSCLTGDSEITIMDEDGNVVNTTIGSSYTTKDVNNYDESELETMGVVNGIECADIQEMCKVSGLNRKDLLLYCGNSEITDYYFSSKTNQEIAEQYYTKNLIKENDFSVVIVE